MVPPPSLHETLPPSPPAGEALAFRHPGRPLGLIGAGAFGAFCIPHLLPHFEIHAHDPALEAVTPTAPAPPAGGHPGLHAASLAEAASRKIVLLATPVGAMREVARAIAPHLRPGALVLDVGSVKVKPLAILGETLPPQVDIVGTHPLFGPQSGRDGIAGLRIALCAVRGRNRVPAVARFLRRSLGLDCVVTTPEEHDRQMAYVQGLTHLISRLVVAMEVPPLQQTTATFGHLMRMVDIVRHDSDELFHAITHDNPFVGEVTDRFFATAETMRQRLSAPMREAKAA